MQVKSGAVGAPGAVGVPGVVGTHGEALTSDKQGGGECVRQLGCQVGGKGQALVHQKVRERLWSPVDMGVREEVPGFWTGQ